MSAADYLSILAADLADQPSQTNIIINNNNSEDSCLSLVISHMILMMLCSSCLPQYIGGHPANAKPLFS